MTLWSKTITYLSTSKDISAYLISMPSYKLTGTGEIRSAEIQLNGKFGAFMTNANGGNTPILDEQDKIKIQITDKNSNAFSTVFEVDTLRPVGDDAGRTLTVGLLAQEKWLHKIHLPKMKLERVSHYEAIKKIIEIYNANKGTSQVTIEKHDDATYNEAPKWTALDFDFSDAPTCYDALMRVINRMNSSVASGGADDFYDLYFEDDPGDDTKIRIKVFSSGSLPASPLTIQNANDTRIYAKNGTKEAKTGTKIIGYGMQGFGSIPEDFSKFWSKLEIFQLHPTHIPGQIYPQGAEVQTGGVHYRANTQTSNTPPHADWATITEADIIGTVPPSKYTYKKATAIWKNSGSNPTGIAGGTGTDFDREGCWDGNLVVRDEDHYRNWVHLKSTTDNFDVTYKYGAAAAGVYRGLRCLVNGTGTAGFAGNDKFGNAFTNAIVKYDGSDWVVIRSAQNNDVCAVIKENKNYIFSGGTWSDDSASSRGNDCFHNIESIQNDTGISTLSKQKGDSTWIDLDGDLSPDTGETYGTDSAVKYTFNYTPFSTFVSSILTTPDYYEIGCWANIMWPLPPNTNNSITEDLGEIYGGDSTTKEPATFDMSATFGLTPTGKQGWNHADSAEQGPVDSIDFMARFKWEDVAFGSLFPFQGNFKFRAICYDDSDNVVYSDFEILDNDRFEQISLPLSGFKPYRARATLKWGNIASNFIVPELEVLERFEWKNLRMMCIQLQEVYDSEGRYSPEGSRFVTIPALIGAARTSLWLDILKFPTQLIVTTGIESTTNIEPDFVDRPNTSNREMLFQDILAQQQVEQHRYDAFNVEGEGFCDAEFGESVFLYDDKLINDSDNGANTKKAVVREMELSINGTDGGPGGLVRKMLVVKRI